MSTGMGSTRPSLSMWGYTLAALALVSVTYGDCEFPKAWTGRWFQSGIRNLVHINTTSIETKGVCVENSGDRFIMEDKVDNCFRCIFITENHANVLQYKETYCADSEQYDSLDNLCSLISGDASLYLMFRDNPSDGPESCPFKGAPFTFTYNRGSGECGAPVSRIDSCIAESRLRIHYQACPDIPATESAVEELVCMATWKEGSARYLIGKISRKVTTSDEDRYRCFVYERLTRDGKVAYDVAQSGDATCSGLQSAQEGSKTMRLTKVDGEHSRCRFPKWLTDHHAWHSLDNEVTYHLAQRNTTLKVTDGAGSGSEARITCHVFESNGESQVRLVAHATRGCNSGYICMVFYRRDAHVIELQQSNVTTQVAEEACSPGVFDQNNTPFTTLITQVLSQRKCPHMGRYSVQGLAPDAGRPRRTQPATGRRRREEEAPDCGIERYQQLVVGCGDSGEKTMEFQAACSAKPDAYSCHASWEVNGTSFVVASPVSRSSVGARRLCLVFAPRSADDSAHTLTAGRQSCPRDSDNNSRLFGFQLATDGQCERASTGAVSATAVLLPSVAFVILLVTLSAHLR